MKKMSIIIPCCNETDDIDKCMELLIHQTIGMESLELIFVNDASRNQTFERLCEWEKKYPDSIMVINCEENECWKSARDIGSQYATTEYVVFYDCNDVVEPTMLDMCYEEYCKVLYYSKLVEENARDEDFEQMNQIVLNSKYLSLYNRFYYWRQALRFPLRKKDLKDKKHLLDEIYHQIYLEYEDKCQDLILPILKEERNPNLIYIITLQFIGLDHPPTRTALERIEVLTQKLHKQVKVVNTREPMTALGKFPMYAAETGSINESISGSRVYQYDGLIFSLHQSEKDMPEIEEVRKILHELRKDKPYLILVIGGSSVVADLTAKMIPVINIPVNFSSIPLYDGQYTAIGRKLSDDEKYSMFGQSISPINIIESIFTFKLKDQMNHFSRSDFALPEEKFLMLVVGTRLHNEVDDEFIVAMEPLLSKNAFLVFAGAFENYDMYCKRYAKLKENSAFLGYQKDIMAVNEMMDLYVNPRRSGGGYSIIEAFSKGVPGVTIRMGDVAAAAGDEFCVENYMQMQQVIERYMTDSDFYRMQVEKAKKRVDEVTDATASLQYILQEAENRELFF